MVSHSSVCLRCFDYHQHQRQNCRRNAVVSCSKCFRMNYLTRECCGGPKRFGDDEYPQVFRLVGTQNTCFFTDIKVGNKFIAALINTNLTTSKIDWAILNLLTKQPNYTYSMTEKTVPLPITLHKRNTNLNCEYGSLSEPTQIELGMDYLNQSSAALKLDGIFVAPILNGLPSKTKEARYIIYVSIYGKMYEAIIDTGIPKSRIDLTMLSDLKKRGHDLHAYDLLRSTMDLQMRWQETEIDMQFCVKGLIVKGPKIRLGNDFLKLRNTHFILDGIDLNINNPWKTTHPNNIEFAYNHPLGGKLRVLLKAGNIHYRFGTNYVRPSPARPILEG